MGSPVRFDVKLSGRQTRTINPDRERCYEMRYAIVLILILLAACTDPKDATRILADQGYTNIQITGYSWFSCSKDDTYRTGFTATAPSGRQVSGTVCAGLLFKNSTIRFE
jgi:hypothetical protein